MTDGLARKWSLTPRCLSSDGLVVGLAHQIETLDARRKDLDAQIETG